MILFYWQKISIRRFSLVTRTSTILLGNPIKYIVQTFHLKSTEQRCPERMVIYPWKHSLLGTELPTRLRSSADLVFLFYCIWLYLIIFCSIFWFCFFTFTFKKRFCLFNYMYRFIIPTNDKLFNLHPSHSPPPVTVFLVEFP